MRKWRNCTLIALGLELTVFSQKQADCIGFKVEIPLKGGHYRY